MITILEAASLDLVDVETAALALGIDDADPQLPAQISAASALVQAYTRRSFNPEELSETLRDVVAPNLILSRFPLLAVSNVVEDGVALESEDFESDVMAGIVYRLRNDRRTAWCAREVVITYESGFDDVPQAVQAAVIDLIRIRRSKASRDPLLRSIDIPEIVSESYWVGGGAPGEPGKGIPSDLAAMLQPYVIRRVAAA